MVQSLHHLRSPNVVARITTRGQRMANVKLFLFIVCISLALSIICIQLVDTQHTPHIQESFIREVIEHGSLDSRYAEVYRKPTRLPKNVKYILLWTSQSFAPFYYFGKGQRVFIANNCPMIDCYVTDDRYFLGSDLRKFHAIAFNGRNIMHMDRTDLPHKRSPQQKYIFFNMESADNYPICNSIFDGFFNWTSTYRLDSDIPYPYLLVKNRKRDVIGPAKDMHWIDSKDLPEVDDDLVYKLHNKTKAVAWFVSHCHSRSGRKNFVRKLKKALIKFKLTVDVYGKCGSLQCPLDKKSDCDLMLEKDYFFYLSMENSFAEDYVTEKLLTALQHDIVPIVYGGANYSRFLPPGSYINAREYTPAELASLIAKLVSSPSQYRQFFRWKYQYSYYDPTFVDNVCSLCATLNDKAAFETSKVYENFRQWWLPDYEHQCKTRKDL